MRNTYTQVCPVCSYEFGNLRILTDREFEISKLLCVGLLRKEIADILYISEHTAKNHITNIHRKLDVRDSYGILRIMLKECIVDKYDIIDPNVEKLLNSKVYEGTIKD